MKIRSGVVPLIRQVLAGDGLKFHLIRGAFGSAGVRAANRLLTLSLAVILARTLGPDGYGVYSYVMAIMGLLMVLAEAGVPTLLMREVAASHVRSEWGVLRGILRRASQFVLLASTVVSFVGFLVLLCIRDNLSDVGFYSFAIMLFLLPLAAIERTVSRTLMGLQRVVVAQVLDMLLWPMFVLVIIASSFFLWPELRVPQYVLVAQCIAALVVIIIGVILLRHYLPRERLKYPVQYRTRFWFKSAFPFMLIGGAGVINNQIDIVMLGWLSSPSDVGGYRVAVQSATIVAFGLQAISAVVAPLFSRLYAQKKMEDLQKVVTGASRVVGLIAFVLASALVFFGEVILSWVFGVEYYASYLPMVILVIGQLFIALFGIVGILVSMAGLEAPVSKAMWISAICNVLLNSVLIPLFGVVGAAASTVVTALLWHVYLLFLAKSRLGILVSPF